MGVGQVMDRYIIRGGRALEGKLTIQGAKNSILPIMAASILNKSEEAIRIKQVPGLDDVRSMLSILTRLGARAESSDGDLILHTESVDSYHVPDDLMREMRSSIFLMGPLLGRLGRVRLCYPGGCAIGKRPIDIHLHGLKAMGAAVIENGEYINARGILRGADINLPYPSVGATENLIMAAVAAKGETMIHNAAREPEIVDLQNFLNTIGAEVSGAGSRTIRVSGPAELHGGSYRVFPDRIAAGTFMLAAAMTKGEITLEQVVPRHLSAMIRVLREAGVETAVKKSSVSVRGGELKAVSKVHVNPYPGFPTDLQPPLIAFLSLAEGRSTVIEHVFKDRFNHVPWLRKMGAKIELRGREALVTGVKLLSGTTVEACDLRAGAALVLAGLAARGETVVADARHIARGYEDLPAALSRLGARIVHEFQEALI